MAPSPFIVWFDRITDRHLTWIMTLDGGTGAQLGERLEIYLPPDHIPVDILWATNFFSLPVRGLEPMPFIVFQDYRLYALPVSYNPDGTPMADEPISLFLPVQLDLYGYATALSKMPGSECADGNPRLYLGTEFGFLVALVEETEDNLVVDEIIPLSDAPVIDLEQIPQYEYISLGVLTDNTIYGIDPEPELHKSRVSSRQSPIYTLSDPRPTTLTDIEVSGAISAQTDRIWVVTDA